MLAFLQRKTQVGSTMSRELSIIHYLRAMAVYRKWLDDGLISEEDLCQAERITASRYGLPEGSIYR